jgi:PAS domain S-box-containing protein
MVERPDGTEIFLEIFGSPVTDSQGQIWASLVSFIDITERKQTEEILRRSEARFRSYFDLPLEGRAISLPDTCWLDVNTTLCDMFGYTKAELTQMTWAELTHPDDLAANFEQLNRVLAGEIDGYTLDKRFIHKDGHTVFSILSVQCVRNTDRSVDCFMTVIQDISARKQMEDALRESEERFRSLVNLVPIPLMFVNKNSAITYFNNRFGKLFGYISADIPTAGKWFHLAYPDKNYRHYVIETWNKAVAKAAREGTDIEPVEYNVTCKDGTVRVMETSGITIGDDLLVSSIDLTEHKRAAEEIKLKNAELLKINAEKDKFFSIIAHDLRSPFNSFLMLTKIIAEGSSRLTMDEIREIAADMRDSAAGIFRLLENLLEWSITQQGLMPFNPGAVQLRPLVAESMAMAQEPAKSKGIEITYDVPDDMTVFAESNMLQTVIRNLVLNAVKFTSKGGKISLSAKTADDRSIEISVKDSGIGMNKALVDNLFRLDIQTNRKGTASEPGSGLGLLLCKEFVEKHGGRIWVESKEGKGTVFNFTIPYNAEQETKILIPAAKKAGKIKDLKILIAEDDEKSEMLIKITVKKFGKEILKARTGTEAVAACRNNPDLDLVLMDIEMPEMDGYKAARQIRQFNQDVVIIAQTAYALVGEREKAIAAGCNDYIAKPFKPSSLTALLEKYF